MCPQLPTAGRGKATALALVAQRQAHLSQLQRHIPHDGHEAVRLDFIDTIHLESSWLRSQKPALTAKAAEAPGPVNLPPGELKVLRGLRSGTCEQCESCYTNHAWTQSMFWVGLLAPLVNAEET